MKNIKALWVYPLILMLSTIVFLAGCKKKVIDIPTVVTGEVTITSPTAATCGVKVTDDGGIEMISRGICWATKSNQPDFADYRTDDGAQTGTFTSKMENLEPNKTYWVRAYATNIKGIAWGETLEFTTGP
jgi:hypothetical protein